MTADVPAPDARESYVLIPTPEQAVALWPQIEAWLKPGLEEDGFYIPTDILAHHLKGELQIWISWSVAERRVEATMVTQIMTYPRKKLCLLTYVRGTNLRRWKNQFIEASENFARQHGCTRMAGGHRRGWVRAAGYREVGVQMIKELT